MSPLQLASRLSKSHELMGVNDWARQCGIDPAPSSPAEFARFVAAEQKKWTPIIKKSNIKVE